MEGKKTPHQIKTGGKRVDGETKRNRDWWGKRENLYRKMKCVRDVEEMIRKEKRTPRRW